MGSNKTDPIENPKQKISTLMFSCKIICYYLGEKRIPNSAQHLNQLTMSFHLWNYEKLGTSWHIVT